MAQPKPATTNKSVMGRLRPLTLQQRIDYQQLLNQGIPESEARAIAQGLAEVGKDAGFDESKHPRARNGEFGQGAGGDKGGKKPISAMQRRSDTTHLREAKGHQAQAAHSLSRAIKLREEGAHDAADKHLADYKAHLGRAERSVEAHRAQHSKGVNKSATPVSDKERLNFLQAFHRTAKARLPAWQHQQLHSHARAVAGGHATAEVREKQRSLSKGGPTASQVHVDVPLGKKPKRQAAVLLKAEATATDATELAYIKQVLGLQDPTSAPTPDAAAVEPEALEAMQANRLIAGMDAEMTGVDITAEQARRRASRVLLERPGHYDQVGMDPSIRALRGLALDLGSGQSRAEGYIGIDLHPFDHGTALWDLDLGIPFPDGSARSIRLVNSLHAILDADGTEKSPVPLLTEVQRVLMEGGELVYEGPEPLYEAGQAWPLPGLALVSQKDASTLAEAVTPGDPVRQVFLRATVRVPAYPGADARFAAADPMPLEDAMALLAQNTSPAALAMANLVTKAHIPERVVPIVKADDDKRICYGEVLNPLTIDSQSDWMTAEDIEAAAHSYMMTSRVIGSEHGAPIEAGVVESFVAPQDLHFEGPSGPVDVPKGTWLIGVKIADDAEWAKVKSGEYTGFSIGGFGVREAGNPMQAAA